MADDIAMGKRTGAFPWRWVGWGLAGTLLLLPLAAMQVTSEVNWDGTDFLFAAIVFGLVGGLIELAVWRSTSWIYRAGVFVAVACGFLQTWISGAVGIIGGEENPADILYLAVVAVAIVGSLLALGRPRGMVWAMLAAAAVEIAVPFLAVALIPEAKDVAQDAKVAVLTGGFTAMWLAAAMLFRRAARAGTA
ncbi:hypothetical protein H8M03_11360 [Sphingomonas sabuli]|uniref:Uncharacterized protein n=1 Tax=Sphingomonas sabuli TaxID=2764186 RepID=A0A7G9L1T6_9SPHN|nr:hypothetical protein [Sphingomonas sabuli]QNM82585.1 hypothetical protein H8M03_11360 [Sphingomonas sabuli]